LRVTASAAASLNFSAFLIITAFSFLMLSIVAYKSTISSVLAPAMFFILSSSLCNFSSLISIFLFFASFSACIASSFLFCSNAIPAAVAPPAALASANSCSSSSIL
jgi:hypothetical protein